MIPSISVIMRSHNDVQFVGHTVEALLGQTVSDFEIILCDDRSTDGTAELLHHMLDGKAIFLQPEQDKYVPGKVLNRAVEIAKGNIVVFNNADAVILDNNWLESLIQPFEDPEVACAFAAQLPREDATPLVKKDYEYAFGDGSRSAKWRHFFSLASSAARKDLLIKYPFDEKLQYSEDVGWSWEIRKKGFKIRYVPEARVEHSHNYTPAGVWKRFYNEGMADAAIYGDKPNFAKAFVQVALESARDAIYCIKKHCFKYAFLAPLYRYRQKISHECGLRDYFINNI